MPYITTFRTGQPSVIPAIRVIRNNYFLGTYSTQSNVDTDDGSAYYNVTDNVFAFGSGAVKSDFGGQYTRWDYNVLPYVSDCLGNLGTWGREDGTGNHDSLVGNKCVVNSESGGFGDGDCEEKLPADAEVSGNKIMTSSGDLDLELCDDTNTVSAWPEDKTLISWAKAKLSLE